MKVGKIFLKKLLNKKYIYTKLAHQEVEQFLEQYNINNFKDYKGITEGVENTNYFINTLEQDYILTIYEKRVDENDLPFL